MLYQIFGGAPVPVIARLALVSILVGAGMMWLDIHPWDLIDDVERSLYHLYATGFVGLNRLGGYLVTGGIIVIPVWVVLRLLSFRSPRPRPARWQPRDGAASASFRTGKTE